MTKQEQAATISALLEERRGYQIRLLGAQEAGDDASAAAMVDRVAGVDAELKRLGASAEKPSSRAHKRPAQRQVAKR